MMTTVVCQCPLCGAISNVTCDEDAYFRYVSTNATIQEVFPDMELHTREILISGMCIPCQERFFVEDDDCEYDGDCENCPCEECRG